MRTTNESYAIRSCSPIVSAPQPEYAEYPKQPHGERSELAKRQAETEYNAQAQHTGVQRDTV
jgi:hypothetical protein